MLKIQLYLTFFLVGSMLLAADLKTKSGKLYENYTIDTATPTGLTIFHSHGASTIPYSDLPDELRNRYKKEEAQAAELQKKHLEQIEEAQKKFKQRQEALNNRRKIKEEEKKLFATASGICGVNIGEKLSNYTLLKIINPYEAQIKLPKQFQGLNVCQVGITSDNIIYQIILREDGIGLKKKQKTEDFVKEMERTFPTAEVKFDDDEGIARLFAIFPPRKMELTFKMPSRKQERNEEGRLGVLDSHDFLSQKPKFEEIKGFWQLKFIDERLKPLSVKNEELLTRTETIWRSGLIVTQVMNGAVLARDPNNSDNIMYIEDINTRNLVDGNMLYNHTINGTDSEGNKWENETFRCWYIGTYRYTTVMGGSKTVRRYTASPARALETYNK